jgi:hypothetical protein
MEYFKMSFQDVFEIHLQKEHGPIEKLNFKSTQSDSDLDQSIRAIFSIDQNQKIHSIIYEYKDQSN